MPTNSEKTEKNERTFQKTTVSNLRLKSYRNSLGNFISKFQFHKAKISRNSTF